MDSMEFTWRMAATLIWPIVAAALLIAYYPLLSKLVSLRIKVGGLEAEIQLLNDKVDTIGQDLSPSLQEMREPIGENEIPTTLVDLIPIMTKNRSDGLHAAYDLVVRAAKDNYPALRRVRPSQLKRAMQGLVEHGQMEPDVAASVQQLQELLAMPEWNKDRVGDSRGYAFLMLAEGAIHEILRTAKHRAADENGVELVAASSWHGTYDGRFPIELRIQHWDGAEFTGTFTYPVDGTVTSVSGRANGVVGEDGVRLSWKESGYVEPGRRDIDFKGEYTAIVNGDRMDAEWHGRQVEIEFTMTAAVDHGDSRS